MNRGEKKFVKGFFALMISALLVVSAIFSGIMVPQTVQAASKPALKKASASVNAGATTQITIKNLAKKATVSYKSLNKKIARVSKKGVVSAYKAGTATIVATVKNGTKTTELKYTLKVRKPVFYRTAVTLEPGKRTKLGIKYKPKFDDADMKLTWSTGNKKVATVSKAGKITAKGEGTTTITLTLETPKKTYKLKSKITVSAKDGSGTDSTGTKNDVTGGTESGSEAGVNSGAASGETIEIGGGGVPAGSGSGSGTGGSGTGSGSGSGSGTGSGGGTAPTGGPNPTGSPTSSPAPTGGENPTATPTAGQNPTPDPTTGPTGNPTTSPAPTGAPDPTSSPTPTGSVTPVPTPGPTGAPNPTGSPNPTGDPDPTGNPNPTGNPTVSPTVPVPTDITPAPTGNVTPVPTGSPTAAPTPTGNVTPVPTGSPTVAPTPTGNITPVPTQAPTIIPTGTPIPTGNPYPTENPTPALKSYRVELTWGAYPKDLDAHLRGTAADGTEAHIYYGQTTQYRKDGTKLGSLDSKRNDNKQEHLDTPETISFTAGAGDDFTFYVYNYSNDEVMSRSSAVVKLYCDDVLTATYKIGTNTSYDVRYWSVFRVQNGRILTLDSYSSSEPVF